MAVPIGSVPWLDQENQQIAQFSAQEAEDFAFSVRNELDFLNEHMAEIFSKNQVNITEVFKTPGKLRGKTPRTARKRNPLEIREPLNDIFAPNAKPTASPSRGQPALKDQRQFEVAKDVAVTGDKENARLTKDSGYHGMTEDEMDIDEKDDVPASEPKPAKESAGPHLLDQLNTTSSREQSTADVFFQSAKEEVTRELRVQTESTREGTKASPQFPTAQANESTRNEPSPQPQHMKPIDDALTDAKLADKASVLDEDVGMYSMRSPSEASSPGVKGLVRKSSLTFAALPAREPLTTKKSLGARQSQVDRGIMSRNSFLGRITGGKSLGGLRQPDADSEVNDDDPMDIDGVENPSMNQQEFDGQTTTIKLHNKSSTQRLHDRINMLGKSQPARPTKSIPAAAALSQVSYPEMTSKSAIQNSVGLSSRADEDDDDWIQPPSKQAVDSPRPQLSKSVSADVMENLRGKLNISDEDFGRTSPEKQPSPRRHSLPRESDCGPFNATSPQRQPGGNSSKTITADQALPSTTPVGTPITTRHVDGPISASKSKLQSIMKTARGLFTSSAGASAQAKLELRNQAQLDSPNVPSPSKPPVIQNNTKLYPSLPAEPKANFALPAARPENPAKPPEGRKTRGSMERERKEKERQQADEESEDREDEGAQKLALPQQNGTAVSGRGSEIPTTAEPSRVQQQPTRKSPRRVQNQDDAPKPTEGDARDVLPAKTMQPPPSTHQSQLQRPREVKRPVKPAKETAPKPEPQRVAIRVGTLSQRIPLTNAALSSGLQDSLAPAPSKRPGLTKKTSTASIQTAASTSSFRAAASKPKALLAAEKKKEQDEKEAQRKQEQKREVERKRAAQQEEARQQEQLQRQEAERQREQDRIAAAEDPKKLAQRQAIEKRRQEMAKKEQQRTAPISQQQVPSTTRPELGGARPPSRMQTVPDYNRPPGVHPAPNPAKAPIKRVLEPEADEPARQSRLPGGQTYQANEAKRRRTNDEDHEEVHIRPTMQPPKRQSNLLKDPHRPYGPSFMGHPSSMASGYPQVKPPANNHAYQPQYQHQNQPSRPGQGPDMTKYANGRIVFAENSNPAVPHAPYKTPNQTRLTNQPATAKASSPHYPNGENIQLDDIPTDSDEGDSSPTSSAEKGKKAKGAMLPTWVQSPYLNELLREQERSQDPDRIFGPSQKVDMEDMFRERHQRFRHRTSSANWAGNDRLTEEEIRRDREARERMRREGGWSFGL
ncbi:MAG: hypothetical protein LQ350_006328 [Teloschistes chrysophthalmus]|nr:MAG: hypothetical protein LQ350_006328 [Niorma chrysophthalma]